MGRSRGISTTGHIAVALRGYDGTVHKIVTADYEERLVIPQEWDAQLIDVKINVQH
jgi:hypothetical protein